MTRKRIVTLVLIATVPLVVGAIIAGFSIWYDSANYIKSESARVSGTVTQVSTPANGEVMDLPFEVGDTVQAGQTVAVLDLAPAAIAGTVGTGIAVQDPIKAPVDGTVIKRFVHVGERANADSPIVSLVNLGALYIVADVDETKVPMIQVGQSATIYLRAFDRNLPGQVGSMTPATSDLVTTATAGQQQSSNATPTVPVIVYFDTQGLPVIPGMTADVTIRVR